MTSSFKYFTQFSYSWCTCRQSVMVLTFPEILKKLFFLKHYATIVSPFFALLVNQQPLYPTEPLWLAQSFFLLFGCPTAIFGLLLSGQPHSPSVNNCVTISFWPRGLGESRNKIESQSLAKCLVGFELRTFQPSFQCLNLLGHSHSPTEQLQHFQKMLYLMMRPLWSLVPEMSLLSLWHVWNIPRFNFYW